MTVTLNSITLNCKRLDENCTVVASQWDAWVSGAYKRKVKAYGIYRVWTLDCVENGVAWASSAAKSFQDTASAGTSVTFSVDDQVRVISTSVYILGVTIHVADVAGQNIRYFTLTLQEA
jgi:hypothetical protein